MENRMVRRGYVPSDQKAFDTSKLSLLKQAAEDIRLMINRGYSIKSVSTFVGNHYLLSERQRLALVRSISTDAALKVREAKRVRGKVKGETVYIDGLNLIITLEVFLSDSTLIQGMDGTIRDLAGLRGTYKLIDKTDIAIRLIGEALERLQVGKAKFYLDAPVSNTGRLKMRIIELLSSFEFELDVELVPNADVLLVKQENVITSDAIILDGCKSWINLGAEIIENEYKQSQREIPEPIKLF